MQRLVGIVAIALLLLAGCGLRGAGRSDAPTLAPGQTPQVPAAATTASGSPSPAAATAATAAPSPTRPPATSPTPTVPPRLFVRIVNTGGLGAYVRAAPTSSASGAVWPEGTVLEVVGADQQGDGGAWKNVRDPNNTIGWTFAAYLTPAEGATGVATVTPGPVTPTTAPRAGGPLDVVAAVDVPIIQGGQQTLHVRVLRGGAPVQGATVAVSAHYRGESRNFTLNPTGPEGWTVLGWDVENLRGPVRLDVDVTAPDGTTAHVTTGFEAR